MSKVTSVNGYPCNNPDTHVYGSLPCCDGIVLDERYLDKTRCIVEEEA